MFQKDIVNVLSKATGLRAEDIQLEVPEREGFGDYATNVALAIFSQKKGQRAKGKDNNQSQINRLTNLKSSRELAEEIVKRLTNDQRLMTIVDKVDLAGPGFINFWLKYDVLLDNLIRIDKEKEEYGNSAWGKGKTMVIDYSSPNIAKRFSIGHLRSTIIGQALYNLYAFGGWKTIGDNHLGDWGTQFGVLIHMVESRNLNPEKLTVEDWEKLYVEFHEELDKDPDLKDKARDAFKRLEEGDAAAKNIWKAAYDTSIEEYERIYDRLNVSIDHAYGESFYQDKMAEAIELAKSKGAAVQSDSALAVEFEPKYKLPSNLLVKSNGTTTYLTRDLALMIFRKREWDPDLQIFEVGADQKLYFQQDFALAEMVGLFKLEQLKHVAHGMIRFREGKMSTRHGKTVKLEEVLDEAVERAKKILQGTETAKDLSEDEIVNISEMVGIGAIKYYDLMHNPTSDIIFEWEKMFVLEGNSGPYLQYTYARTQSVLRKSQNIQTSKYPNNLKINDEEANLLRSSIHFAEVIESAAKSYSPNILANYLFELAQKFNLFYQKHRILGEVDQVKQVNQVDQRSKNSVNLVNSVNRSTLQDFRLALTSATGQILKNGLGLLGIETPERM